MPKEPQPLSDEAKKRVLGHLVETAERVLRDEERNPIPTAVCDRSEHGKGPSTLPHDFTVINFINEKHQEHRLNAARARIEHLRERLEALG